MVDYYKVLDLQRSASETAIKKAYKKLALKWHPDKNPDNLDAANKRFKEISEAYEVLSDPKKRRVYDQYGKDGLLGDHGERRGTRHQQSEGFDNFDFMGGAPFVFRPPEEVFREFFGVNSPFADLLRDVLHPSGSTRFSSSARSSNGQSGGPTVLNYSAMDFIMPAGGFTSFSTFTNGASTSRGSSSRINPNVKCTSTATTYINGKKIVTKRIVENGKEVIFSYENDVLKSKTVNGVPQKLSPVN